MGLLSVSSPHSRKPGDTGAFMRQVIYATVPGALALTVIFGWGIIVNLIIAVATALISEALVGLVPNPHKGRLGLVVLVEEYI